MTTPIPDNEWTEWANWAGQSILELQERVYLLEIPWWQFRRRRRLATQLGWD
jgi:hypothetical protein